MVFSKASGRYGCCFTSVIKLSSSDIARSIAQLPPNVFDVNEIKRTTREMELSGS